MSEQLKNYDLSSELIKIEDKKKFYTEMKTTAIVPVFNEEKTVKKVLTVLNNSDLVNDIIVVDDASSDDSLKKIKDVKSNKLRLISLKKNLGKSGAVKLAAQNLKTDILLFCDADLVNLKEEHIGQIIGPLKDGKTAMSVGLRDYGLIGNFLYKNGFFPLIAGERALSYSIFKNTIKNPFMKGYGLEPVLNYYCKENKIPVHKNIMKGLKQTLKPKKWKHGAYLLAKEMFHIFSIILMLKMKIKNF